MSCGMAGIAGTVMVLYASLIGPVIPDALGNILIAAVISTPAVLTLVFQDGHGESLLGFHSIGGVTSWLPLFLFVILFGLSMDYHVFILSRIREAVDGGMSTDRAVAHGIKQTAGVVTSAAVVMVAVFAIFATLSSLEFKQMGVGLAAAVLIDATIVRAVLLPATMKLLGDWNWYLPRKLRLAPAARARAARRSRPRRRDARYSRRMRAHAAVAVLLSCPSPRAAGGSPRRSSSPRATRSASASTTRIAKQPDPKNAADLAALAQADGRDLRPGDRRHGGARAAGRAGEATSTTFVASLKQQRDLTKQIGDAAGKGDTAKIQQIGDRRAEGAGRSTASSPARSASRNAEGVSDMARFGVLTGGGDCPGLNAVIRAIVRAGQPARPRVLRLPLRLGRRARRRRRRADRGGHARDPAPRRDDPRDLADEPVQGGERARARAARRWTQHNLDGLIPIGGEDTLGVAGRLSEDGVDVVGVPKTIDNDLAGTDFTFGFQTAVQIATDAIDRLHTTAESHNRVIVVEVMGRTAGWIACYSGMAGGADVILVPERPFDIEEVCERVRHRHESGHSFSIVVVAEGATPKDGEVKSEFGGGTDAFGHVRLGGIAVQLEREIEERTGFESRMTILGHVQRGGTPLAYDRVLGTRFGVAAIDAASTRATSARWSRCAGPRSSSCRSTRRWPSRSCSTRACTRPPTVFFG